MILNKNFVGNIDSLRYNGRKNSVNVVVLFDVNNGLKAMKWIISLIIQNILSNFQVCLHLYVRLGDRYDFLWFYQENFRT